MTPTATAVASVASTMTSELDEGDEAERSENKTAHRVCFDPFFSGAADASVLSVAGREVIALGP